MNKKHNILDTRVYIFYTKERTLDLCIHSLKQLGLNNTVVIDGDDSFRAKYIRCANDAMSTGDSFFIRTDADIVLFDGLLHSLKCVGDRDDLWVEGKYYDYFMNRLRGGTPHVIPKKAMDLLASDNSLIPDSKKPETDFSTYLRNNKLVDFKYVDAVTCLHDFEQYPSKACNSFLNRLKRGHTHLYDNNYLSTLPTHYKNAIQHAINVFSANKYANGNSIDFSNFDFLDKDFPQASIDVELTYQSLRKIYDKI